MIVSSRVLNIHDVKDTPTPTVINHWRAMQTEVWDWLQNQPASMRKCSIKVSVELDEEIKDDSKF